MLLKNDKNGWIQETVHTAIIEKTALVIFGRGAEIGRVASCKISHQYFGEKHGLDRRTYSAVVIRICSIPCKVTSYKEERHKEKETALQIQQNCSVFSGFNAKQGLGRPKFKSILVWTSHYISAPSTLVRIKLEKKMMWPA